MFVATSQDIAKIWKTIENNGMSVNVTVSCSDGLVRTFEDCEKLIEYDNPKRAQITAIEISGRCRDPYTTTEITLGRRYSSNVSVSIRGEESLVESSRILFSDILDGMKPWYSKISSIDLWYVFFPIFMVLVLLVQIMAPSNNPKQAIPLDKALVILATALAAIGSIGAFIWVISSLRKRFFPINTFAIGQGLARHQQYEQIRWVVIVGFLVSIFSSIVATLLLAA